MAFDVAGAKKAGYTDAEIAAHLAKTEGYDLAGAKRAGWTDGEVVAHLSSRPARAEIPVDTRLVAPPAQGPAPLPAAPPGAVAPMGASIPTLPLGVDEAILSALSAPAGAMGMIGGALKSIAERVLSGEFGTPESARMIEQAASAGGQALTYAPRTPLGQEIVGAVGEISQQAIPLAGLQPQINALTQGMKPAAVAAVNAARTVPPVAAGAIAATRQAAGRVGEAVQARMPGQQPAAAPTRFGSVGAAGTEMAAQRRALGADFPVPMPTPTKGQLSRDPAQLKFEVETAKIPDAGAPLRERHTAQNNAILRNFDTWIGETGADAPSLRAVGKAVDEALVAKSKRDKAEYRTTYKEAEKAGELEAPVQLDALVAHLNDSMPDVATAPLLDTARKRAIRLGIAAEDPATGELVAQPVTLRFAEAYRQSVGQATDYAPTNIRQSAIIKGLVDGATEGLGGNLYRKARSQRARYARQYENRAVIADLLSTKRGMEDRKVALEDVFDRTILKGSLDDARTVRKVLQTEGETGKQAWRELQGATVRYIYDRGTSKSATNGAGEAVVLPDGLVRAVKELDTDGKLDFVFGKKGAQQMRDIAEWAQIAKTVPPEAAVNVSNTAATLMFGADLAISGLGGLPLPVATLTRAGLGYIKDRRLRNRIQDALNEVEKKAPNNKRRAPPVQDPTNSPEAMQAPAPDTLQ